MPPSRQWLTHFVFRHIEGKSTIFGTAMNYVAYRLLGGEVDDPTAAKARKFLLDNGTAREPTALWFPAYAFSFPLL